MATGPVETLEVDVLDTVAPGKAVFSGADTSAADAVVTFACPSLDSDGTALTGLENAYWTASRDPAAIQAAIDNNYAELLSLAVHSGTIDLAPADAGQNKSFSFPKGAAGKWYVGVWFDDVPTAGPPIVTPTATAKAKP